MNHTQRAFTRILVVFLAVVTSWSSVLAQSNATLAGTITDPSGAVIAGAHVRIHSTATGTNRDLVSDNAGAYSAPSLLPGDYTIDVNATGFATKRVVNVTLLVGQTVTVNVPLSLATTGEVVQVSGAAPIIDTQTTTVGQAIDQRTVQNIPLNGRHFLDLTALTPGTVTAPTSGSLTAPSRGLGANSFDTAGNREDSVDFMINGVNLNDLSQNQITFQPSIDTTSEFSITNATFSADQGRSSGAVVNVLTRSGTNQFHGQVFDYIRNNDLDARNYFNRAGTPMDSLKRNNFGVDFSGPIFRNRTFFFASYEGLRQAQTLILTSQVLTPAQRTELQAAAPPGWANILNVLPLPNTGTDIFNGSSPGPVQIDQYTLDLLHNISSTDIVHGYYAYQQDKRTEPSLQGNTLPGFGDHRDAHRQVLTLNETHTFSSNLVNEGRIGFNRIAIAFDPNATYNPVNYGISDGLDADVGLPQISVPTLGLNIGGPSGFPQGRYDTTAVVSDTLSWLKGKNSFKFGGEFRRVEGNNFSATPGTLSFSSVTAFIDGDANSFTITPQRVVSRDFDNSLAAFAQDNYKFSSRLTLNGGLRFEWNGTPTEGDNRYINFLPTNDSLTQVGTNGYHSVYNQNYNVEPRVGFAYDVFGTGATIVRGGYGYLVDQPVIDAVTGLAGNPNLATPLTLTSTNGTSVGSLYASAKAAGVSPSAINTNLRNAYVQSYTLNLQQQLGSATAVQLAYVGSVGRHLRDLRNINQPTLPGGTRPYPTLSASSPILPGSAIGNISEVNDGSNSSYNALWATVRRTFSHGFEFNTTYTWTKSLDENSLGSEGGNTYQDSFNPHGNYGLSDFDARNRWVFSGIWDLPFKGDRLKDGWQLSNITQLQSGNPINVTTTSVYNGVSGTTRPNLVGHYSTGETKLTNGYVQYLNALGCDTAGAATNACTFVAPTTGFGDFGRNVIIGPGFLDSDLSLQKTTKIVAATSFVFRVDAFDFINHPSFGQPNASISDTSATTTGTTFGDITATRFPVADLGSSRQLQFSLKVLF
jgi:Carboxypeptidase regulatory-like domain